MFTSLMWDVKEPAHYSRRVWHEVPGVVTVLCVSVGIAGPHQLNSCQNFDVLKQINNKQTNNKQTNKKLSPRSRRRAELKIMDAPTYTTKYRFYFLFFFSFRNSLSPDILEIDI